jgi:hypothetical protein
MPRLGYWQTPISSDPSRDREHKRLGCRTRVPAACHQQTKVLLLLLVLYHIFFIRFIIHIMTVKNWLTIWRYYFPLWHCYPRSRDRARTRLSPLHRRVTWSSSEGTVWWRDRPLPAPHLQVAGHSDVDDGGGPQGGCVPRPGAHSGAACDATPKSQPVKLKKRSPGDQQVQTNEFPVLGSLFHGPRERIDCLSPNYSKPAAHPCTWFDPAVPNNWTVQNSPCVRPTLAVSRFWGEPLPAT